MPVPVSDFSFSTKRRKKKVKTLNPVREHRRAAAAARFADDVEVARVRAFVCVLLLRRDDGDTIDSLSRGLFRR